MIIGENATVDTNNITTENNTNLDGKADIMQGTELEVEIDGLNVSVSLTAQSGNFTGNVTVNVAGKDYVVPVVNGKASFTIDPLTYGEYPVTVRYSGDDVHAVAYKDATIVVDPVRTVIRVVSVGGDLTITGVLKDQYGNVLSGMTVEYVVDGVKSSVVTDSNGMFTVKGKDNAKVEFVFEGKDEFVASKNSITFNNAVPTMTESKFNITSGFVVKAYAVDYKAGERGSYFIVRLTDVNGNPIANSAVQFGINGITHNKTTDANGVVELQINLQKADTYTCAVAYVGDDSTTASFAVAKLVVSKKPVSISAAAKSFKKATKTKKYTVTLKTIKGSSANGKVYLKSGKKVTLKVNGKTYTAKTNAKGQATFKITKLTKKGKFTAVVKFAGDATYKAVSKKVKITVK